MDVGVYNANILHRLDGGELQLRSRLQRDRVGQLSAYNNLLDDTIHVRVCRGLNTHAHTPSLL